MARVAFSTDNKVKNPYDFPKLKLKNQERARIVLLEEPEMEYAHQLNAPSVNGGVGERVNATRANGQSYETWKMDFIGNPLCLGDPGILEERGSDPDNCPVCALAKSSDMAAPPKRRFAMHVLRYATQPGKFDVQDPFQVQTLVWAFTDVNFNKIADAANEWGDLRQHDLLLGPCTGETFQKYEIAVAKSAAWMEDDARKQLSVSTFKNNRAEDLSVFCGRKKELKWLEEDIATVRERWAIVTGTSSDGHDASASVSGAVGGASLSEGLDGLLDAAPKAAPAPAANVDALLDSEGWSKKAPEEPAAAALAPEEPKAEPAPAAPAAAAPAAASSVDDLLAGL